MEFDSPEVMKDFPGLYSSEKKKGNDSDYNDDTEKTTKKEMLIGKRKDKKDKKDKDKGYAALEGESSDEESPHKAKKSKAFKFSKSKDKEKEKCKEKSDAVAKSRLKKKDKIEKPPKNKKTGPSKVNPGSEGPSIGDSLPIFGVDIEKACQRAKCHDGHYVPLPIRQCIDYIEANGITFESVYKISGPKTKVTQIKKMYNNRQMVKFLEYDVPTATSVLKTFLRKLPEPLFTNDLLIRFEEAGAILNFNTREKHLKNLIETLPTLNRQVLAYLIVHLYNVTLQEQVNKMSRQSLAQALNHTFHVSSRLLQALIQHRDGLFPGVVIVKYTAPLDSMSILPDSPTAIQKELYKLESLLGEIHWEMNNGYFSKVREEQMWDAQRVITNLKRKMKKFIKVETVTVPDQTEEPIKEENVVKIDKSLSNTKLNIGRSEPNSEEFKNDPVEIQEAGPSSSKSEEQIDYQRSESDVDTYSNSSTDSDILEDRLCVDEQLMILRVKNSLLKDLVQRLEEDINKEKREIEDYDRKIQKVNQSIPPRPTYVKCIRDPNNFVEVKNLLEKENQMLQIQRVQLVRKAQEQREQIVELAARIRLLQKLPRHEPCPKTDYISV